MPNKRGRRSRTSARETPVLGPRRRPTKVKPVSPQTPRGGSYKTGVPEVRTSPPWVDEGTPEVNG